jgi:hypothetical protein
MITGKYILIISLKLLELVSNRMNFTFRALVKKNS